MDFHCSDRSLIKIKQKLENKVHNQTFLSFRLTNEQQNNKTKHVHSVRNSDTKFYDSILLSSLLLVHVFSFANYINCESIL